MGAFGVGSTKPITFIGTGKPVSPSPPQRIDRSASSKGITFSGGKSARELMSKIRANIEMTPKELGDGAVKLSKSMGISINVTI